MRFIWAMKRICIHRKPHIGVRRVLGLTYTFKPGWITCTNRERDNNMVVNREILVNQQKPQLTQSFLGSSPQRHSYLECSPYAWSVNAQRTTSPCPWKYMIMWGKYYNSELQPYMSLSTTKIFSTWGSEGELLPPIRPGWVAALLRLERRVRCFNPCDDSEDIEQLPPHNGDLVSLSSLLRRSMTDTCCKPILTHHWGFSFDLPSGR